MLSRVLNIGLVQRALRETLMATLTLGLLLASVSALLAYALPRIQARFAQRNFIPPGLREFRQALFGFDPTDAGVSEIAFSLAWSHPIVIAILSAHAIVVCTRVLAGEVERGTVDVLMALPVRRFGLLVSETAAWLITAILLFGMMFAGSYFGAQFIRPEFRPDWARLAMVVPNLMLVYAVIGCTGMLFATLSDRRVRAVLAVVILTVSSVLVSFLYLLDKSLEFTKQIAFLSVMEYYRPIGILMEGQIPWRNLGILGGITAGLWILTAIILTRRDVTTT